MNDASSGATRPSAHEAHWASANKAEAADPASVITLANELRAALVEKGLIQDAA